MSDSDFEEIQPVGLPCKRYPSCKPRATMGELVSSDTSDFEEDPEERQRTERAATAAVRRRNGPQVAFGAQARQQPGLGRGRGQPRQRRGQSGLRGGTRSQGRGARGHPVGARQVGRAPQAVPIQRQLSLQYHVDDEDNRILNLSDDPPLNLVTVAEQVPESTLNPQDSLQDEVVEEAAREDTEEPSAAVQG